MKYIITLLAILSYSASTFAISTDELINNSIKERMSITNLQANQDFYSKLSNQDKKLLIKSLFLEYVSRKDQTNQERLNFTKVLAEVADITTTNLVKNSVFELQLPDFDFRPTDNIIKNYQTNYLSLLPSATYLLDFKNKSITLTGRYPVDEYESVDNYVYIAYDSIRNFAVINFPELNSNEVVSNSKISFETLTERLLNTNPNFNVDNN
jgi:hypothetical protein